ncbi:hypothetical protein HWV62_8647, partial [Athelia sp. TMB]
QKAAGELQTKEMMDEIAVLREHYRSPIITLAGKYNQTPEFMAIQLYRAPPTVTKKKPSLFNTVLHDRAVNGMLRGQQALPDLAKSIAAEHDWRDVDSDEESRLMEQLEASKSKKENKKVAKVSQSKAGNDNLEALALRNSCHIFYLISHGNTTDNFMPRSFATPAIGEALQNIFRHTPNDMVLKVDTFMTTGLAGVLRMTDQNKSTRLKSEIRHMVSQGFHAIIIAHQDCDPHALPQMNYTDHDTLVCKWGVELVGWTEPAIVNPSKISTAPALSRLVVALCDQHCHWVVLDAESWDTHIEARLRRTAAGQIKSRKQRKDKGTSKKRKLSVSDSDEDEETPAGGDSD